ncbi:MAG TPA: peptidase M16 [Flavobacteriales bacterium]|nr:peptidase M16 [Flavobacteriales bacterium]
MFEPNLMTPEFHTHTLPNGLRVIHAHKAGQVTHCALVVNAGTRDERKGEEGLAHFIEHVLFKGTTKRKAFHILNRMESVGGEINAYTTKEDTWLTSSQRNKDTERALELLADVAFRSVFPKGELDKERDVVLDEIAGVDDTPGDVIFETFDSHLFGDHALGRPILGTPGSVKALTRDQVCSFVDTWYRPTNMVLGVVGNVTWTETLSWAERHFAEVGRGDAHPSPVRVAPPQSAGTFCVEQRRNVQQVHHVMGGMVPGGDHKDKLAMTMVANVLGGPAMNCRLNLNIREKHGMAYHIEANHMMHQDVGVFNVYYGTDVRFHKRVSDLVRREVDKMRHTKLGVRQLHEAKQQLLGQIALSHEHGGHVLSGLAKTFLVHGRVETLDAVLKAIEALTAEELREVAHTWLDPQSMGSVTFLPD